MDVSDRVDTGTIVLSTYAEAREGLRERNLRQALYDDGHLLMSGVIVNLHGDDHRSRRRLENRLFRRDTFLYYQRRIIPEVVREVLAPALASGRGDLLPLARRTMMMLSATIAGVDLPAGTPEEFDRLYDLMLRLQRASTLVHARGNKSEIEADGQRALAEFCEQFLESSVLRRRQLLVALDEGTIGEDDLPRDVLTTLLRNQDELVLPPDVIGREVAYFPWVGSFSTSDAFVHAMAHVLDWLVARPQDREALRDDELVVQRFVHESLRLHPASPEARRVALADIELRTGTRIPAGRSVVIDLVQANRDTTVFGPDAASFDPYRSVPQDVPRWGLTFGHGFHACLGQELAGGVELSGVSGGGSGEMPDHLSGAVVVMAQSMLAHGVRADPDDPPALDPGSIRPHFGRYPVLFGPVAG